MERKKTKVECSRRIGLAKAVHVTRKEKAKYVGKEKGFRPPKPEKEDMSNRHEFFFDLFGIEVDVYGEQYGYVHYKVLDNNLDMLLCQGDCPFAKAMDTIITVINEHKARLEKMKKGIKASNAGMTMISDKIAQAFLEDGFRMTDGESRKKGKFENRDLERIWEEGLFERK